MFVVVEAGAGPGTLARTVLAADPGVRRRCATCSSSVAAQRACHARAPRARDPRSPSPALPDPDEDGEAGARRHRADRRQPRRPAAVPGPCVVIANELLDNLPFGLLERADDGWTEVRVGLDGRALVEVARAADGPVLDARPVHGSPSTRRRRWVRDARALAGPKASSSRSTTRRPRRAGRRPWSEWVRTYRGTSAAATRSTGWATQDITCEVAVDQLPAPARDVSQADWLRAHGIDELGRGGPATWEEHAAIGDLAACRARSRVSEADALLDPSGLGAFRVLEWDGPAW